MPDQRTADAASWRAHPVSLHRSAGDVTTATWGIAVEAPVAITLNGVPWTVMLASPADLEDLAVGLALTERVLRDPTAVLGVDVAHFLQEASVDLLIPESALDREAMRARSLVSSTACGLCGVESLAQWHQRAGTARPRPVVVSDAAVRAAASALPRHQPVNEHTRSVHAAAWCTPDGDITLAREDVGRHNALDKLVGALARGGRLRDPGFIVMSSRCSYELVYKAATANTQMLVTLSAPTSLALTWARELALPLACIMPDRGAGLSIVHFPAEPLDIEVT